MSSGDYKPPWYASSLTDAKMDTLEARGVVAGFLQFTTNVPIFEVK
jgi:hypothetical protein